MFLLPSAALGESRGFRTVFSGGVVLFTAASGLCALAPSLPWLAAARFVQGIGGAAVMSLGVGLLRFIYPQRLLGTAIGWNALAVALASAAGPTIGAAILSVASWPWLFAVNIPVGALVLIAAPGLPGTPGSMRGLDPVSVLLNIGAFGAFVVGADLAATRPWLAAGLLPLALAGFTVLVRRESPREAPLIPIDLLRVRSFRLSVIASIFCFSGQMAGLVALPFHLQHVLHQDTFMTGLYLTPWPLAVALAAPLSGRAADRLPTAWLCAAGGACLAAGLALVALWPLREGPLPLALLSAVCGFGFGVFQTPNNRNMLTSAARGRSGAAGGAQGSARLIGQTAGALIMTLLFSLASGDLAPRLGLGIAAVLALVGGLISALRIEPVPPLVAGADGR
jgi:DHA2 family multidrug resistance protein-like MFS transporter